MAPKSSISHRWLQTFSTKGGGICLNHSLKGVSSVILIICLVEWVQPSLPGSNEKTSWYSTKSDWAESDSSRGHDSKPLRSSSSILPLSYGQPRCLRTVRLLLLLWQSGCHWCFWHHSCHHSSGHQSFLLESLEIGCTVLHHHNSILAACSQLNIPILHSESLRQRPILDSQCLGHHNNSLPSVSFLCLHGYNMRRKGISIFLVMTTSSYLLGLDFSQLGCPLLWLLPFTLTGDGLPRHLPKVSPRHLSLSPS